MITRGPDGKPNLFADFPAEMFPITLTAFCDGEELWERVVQPYVMVDIPGASEEQRGKVSLRVEYGDGRRSWVHPEEGGSDV